MTERHILAYKHRRDGEKPTWHRQRTDSAGPLRAIVEMRESEWQALQNGDDTAVRCVEDDNLTFIKGEPVANKSFGARVDSLG